MSLQPGHKLAHYEIVEPIGKGGMGEVYRARDGKLGRDVAIKVLPDEFAENEERLARFKREAKVLASLNHPGIAAIHGLEESEGTLSSAKSKTDPSGVRERGEDWSYSDTRRLKTGRATSMLQLQHALRTAQPVQPPLS